MRKYVLALLLLLVYQPLSAQDSASVLRWVTSEGVLGSYSPDTQAMHEDKLPFTVNTSAVQWLPGGAYFVYRPDQSSLSPLYIVDVSAGKLACTLNSQQIIQWEIWPVQADTLLLYEAVDGSQTAITLFNWRSCTQVVMATVDGTVEVSALNMNQPFIALRTSKAEQTLIHVFNLATGELQQIDDMSGADDISLYWTQDNQYLLIQNPQAVYLYSPATRATQKMNTNGRYLWPVPNTPLLIQIGASIGVPTRFWTFENGTIVDMVFEIPDEVYDHEPGFSPDYRYYAYTRTSSRETIQVFDWQTGKSTVVDSVEALKRWSPDSQWLTLILRQPDQIRLFNMQTGDQQTYDGSIDWYGDDIWSSDSQQIAFWRQKDDKKNLMVANLADGSTMQVYTQQALDFPSSVRWSSDSAYLYVNTVQMGVNQTFESCHRVVQIASRTAHTLGCGDWSVKWG